MNPRPTRDLALVNAAGFLRSFGVGLLGVVLGIYLSRVGLSSLEIGFVIAAGLAGSALATVVMSVAADRMGRRRFLVLLSFLTTIGGLALALRPNPEVLALMAFVGMLMAQGPIARRRSRWIRRLFPVWFQTLEERGAWLGKTCFSTEVRR